MLRSLALDGVIATNTTVTRSGIDDVRPGDLSGAPLRSFARRELGADAVIIGVGGIDTAEDARAMLAASAGLVQVYTSLVYRGPALLRELRTALSNR